MLVNALYKRYNKKKQSLRSSRLECGFLTIPRLRCVFQLAHIWTTLNILLSHYIDTHTHTHSHSPPRERAAAERPCQITTEVTRSPRTYIKLLRGLFTLLTTKSRFTRPYLGRGGLHVVEIKSCGSFELLPEACFD